MNIVDILIIAVLGFGLLSGMHKGSITSALSTFGFVFSWFGAQRVYERIANYALSNTTLMAVLNQYLEPDSFFESHSQAVMAVSDVIAGGEQAISAAVDSVGSKFSFIAQSFSANIRTQAFQNLGITSLSDYLNQTLWVAVFNVLAFIAAFILIYIVISLLVNLLDHVISFPVLRGFDWLLGGVLGLLRSSVVVVLVLSILPTVTNIVSPELTQQLTNGSVLYTFATQFDPLSVASYLSTLIAG